MTDVLTGNDAKVWLKNRQKEHTDHITAAVRERAGIWPDGRYWTADEPVTVDRFDTASSLLGRNAGPSLLFDLWQRDLVPTDVLRVVLPDVWSGAEYPERYVFRSIWVHWFRAADYPKPSEPLTIYRGATPRRSRRMAWTTSLLRASWFADRFGTGLELDPFIMEHGTPEAKAAEEARYAHARSVAGRMRKAYVYTATVEPAGILAVLDGPDMDPDRARNEEEVIIDPAYLPRRLRRAD